MFAVLWVKCFDSFHMTLNMDIPRFSLIWVTVLNLVKPEEFVERLKKIAPLHLSNGPWVNLTVAEKIDDKIHPCF